MEIFKKEAQGLSTTLGIIENQYRLSQEQPGTNQRCLERNCQKADSYIKKMSECIDTLRRSNSKYLNKRVREHIKMIGSQLQGKQDTDVLPDSVSQSLEHLVEKIASGIIKGGRYQRR